jgi:hypothetical protein
MGSTASGALEPMDIPAKGCKNRARKRSTIRKAWLFAIIVLAGAAALLFYTLNERDAPDFNELLTRAKLARLPASITHLQVDIRPAVDNGQTVPNEYWLFARFEAEPDDIGRFVNESAGIDKRSSRPLSTATNSSENPSWWSIDQSAPGRIYHFRSHEDIHTGDVVVDDASNTVLLFVWFQADPPYSIEDLKEDVEDLAEDVYRKF